MLLILWLPLVRIEISAYWRCEQQEETLMSLLRFFLQDQFQRTSNNWPLAEVTRREMMLLMTMELKVKVKLEKQEEILLLLLRPIPTSIRSDKGSYRTPISTTSSCSS